MEWAGAGRACDPKRAPHLLHREVRVVVHDDARVAGRVRGVAEGLPGLLQQQQGWVRGWGGGGACITCKKGANTAGGARPHLRHVERVRTARARDATLDVHRGRGVDVVARRLGAVEDGPSALVVVRLRARCAGGRRGAGC